MMQITVEGTEVCRVELVKAPGAATLGDGAAVTTAGAAATFYLAPCRHRGPTDGMPQA